MTSLRSQAGVGFVDLLLGIAIVGVVAVSLTYYSGMTTSALKAANMNQYSCVAHGSSVLAKLRAKTDQFSVASFVPFQNNRTPGPSTFTAPEIIPAQALWEHVPPVSTLDAPPYVYGASLYQSPMRIFNSLYNRSDVDFCSNFTSSAEFTTLGNSVASGVNYRIQGTITTRLRVRLYETATGNVLPCQKPIWVAPKSEFPGDAQKNGVAAGFVRNYAQVRDDVGLLLEVQTEYTDPDDGHQTCVVSDRLTYGVDNSFPPAPQISMSGVGVAPADGGNAHQTTAQIAVVSPGNGDTNITVCRDRSTLIPATTTYQCYATNVPGPGPQRFPGHANEQFAIAVGLPAAYETEANQHGASRPAAWANRGWVSCEAVTLCGRDPDASTLSMNASNGYAINNTYSNLRTDCIARVEAATVDSSGNLNDGGSPYNPSQISISATSYTSTIRPTCGNWCTNNGYWTGNLNSYWQTSPCCVGVGCVRGGGLPLSEDPAI